MTEPRQTSADFPRAVLDLFDRYVHGDLTRRGFLDGAARHVGGAAAAVTVLGALAPDFARGQVVAPDDRRVTTRWLDVPSPAGNGTIRAYVARSSDRSARRRGVVLVVHENRGLNPHIQDIARRLATHGFLAVAPDGLTTLGGYPGDEDKARELFGKLDRAKLDEDFVVAARAAQALPEGNGKLGVTGFCYGGGVAGMLATRLPTLAAAAPFYGSPPPADGLGAIRAELLVHLAGNDARVNARWPDTEAAMKKAGINFRVFTYEGAEHGFNNDTTPRFNADAAKLAWERTIDLFKRRLA